jgi:hypothetical protein
MHAEERPGRVWNGSSPTGTRGSSMPTGSRHPAKGVVDRRPRRQLPKALIARRNNLGIFSFVLRHIWGDVLEITFLRDRMKVRVLSIHWPDRTGVAPAEISMLRLPSEQTQAPPVVWIKRNGFRKAKEWFFSGRSSWPMTWSPLSFLFSGIALHFRFY